MVRLRNFFKKSITSQNVFYRYFRRKGWRRFLKENILESAGCNRTKALSIALGVFVGISPFWGFHTVMVIFLASFFKLNKVLSYMCTHISFPPLIPFILGISLLVGSKIVGGETNFRNEDLNLDFVKNHLLQYIVGSLALATSLAAAIGGLSYLILERLKPTKNTK